MSNTIERLIKLCKAGIYITINEHKDSYESIETYLAEIKDSESGIVIEKDIEEKIIELDTIVKITFYPDTPIGQYTIIHYDYDLAMGKVVKIMTTIDAERRLVSSEEKR